MGERAVDKSNLVAGATGDWEVVIGLEVHAQVASKAKLFSGAATDFGGAPNDHVSLVDAAMPGMLPVINAHCIEQAVRTGLGLNARINLRSVFDRKNYFYPDLPQGYQISQFKQPIVGEGTVVLDLEGGETVEIGIERLHLEQDAGKSLHDQHADRSLVDLNRSGVALMEIVSKPDLRSAEEAKTYVRKLRGILRKLGTCDGNMEEGSLRADVNVSVRRPGEDLGTRAEIKNVNSFRFIGQAIDYEARRQIDLVEDGGTVVQETRLFDSRSGTTRPMRSKEEAHDYRYFPDPDLLPLEFDQAYVDEIKVDVTRLLSLAVDREADYVRRGMSPVNASRLAHDDDAADYFDSLSAALDRYGATLGEAKFTEEVAKWLLGDFLAVLNEKNAGFSGSRISPAANAAILALQFDGTISRAGAREVLKIKWNDEREPAAIVKELGLTQVSDAHALEKIVEEVIAANPDKAAEVKDKPKMLGWFVGQVMQKSGGKANPKAVNSILRARLGLE